MFNRRFAVCVSAVLTASAARMSTAAEPTANDTGPVASNQPFGLTEPIYLDHQGTARRPLMDLLDSSGAGSALEDAHINLFGHVEGSWTYNANNPGLNANFGRIFDVDSDQVVLNQVEFSAERTVDPAAGNWDVGFRMDWLYGRDARFVHANGLFDHYIINPQRAHAVAVVEGPKEQFDLLQLYADVAAPIGNGLRIRVGKFEYFKEVDSSQSSLFSRSFSYASSLPYTLTGVYATYPLNKSLTVEAGFSRGWDQSLEDNNGAIDGFGSIRYEISDLTDLTLKVISGPELPGNSGAYRTAVDLTLSHRLSDQVTLVADAMYAYQAGSGATAIDPNASVDPTAPVPLFTPGILRSDAQWWGVAGYALVTVNKYVDVNTRLEIFRDEDGATFGVPGNTLLGATAGLTVTPFPDNNVASGLKIRPEVRLDYARRRTFNIDATTGDITDHNQLTFAIDAFFAF